MITKFLEVSFDFDVSRQSSIQFVKRLSLCASYEYQTGFSFHQAASHTKDAASS